MPITSLATATETFNTLAQLGIAHLNSLHLSVDDNLSAIRGVTGFCPDLAHGRVTKRDTIPATQQHPGLWLGINQQQHHNVVVNLMLTLEP
jgi:hypothetical protein